MTERAERADTALNELLADYVAATKTEYEHGQILDDVINKAEANMATLAAVVANSKARKAELSRVTTAARTAATRMLIARQNASLDQQAGIRDSILLLVSDALGVLSGEVRSEVMLSEVERLLAVEEGEPILVPGRHNGSPQRTMFSGVVSGPARLALPEGHDAGATQVVIPYTDAHGQVQEHALPIAQLVDPRDLTTMHGTVIGREEIRQFALQRAQKTAGLGEHRRILAQADLLRLLHGAGIRPEEIELVLATPADILRALADVSVVPGLLVWEVPFMLDRVQGVDADQTVETIVATVAAVAFENDESGDDLTAFLTSRAHGILWALKVPTWDQDYSVRLDALVGQMRQAIANLKRPPRIE